MSRWFRSEPMEYISLIVNEDAAHDCLADLGKLGVIQFTDVSHNYEYMMLLWYCYLSSGWSMYYFIENYRHRYRINFLPQLPPFSLLYL